LVGQDDFGKLIGMQKFLQSGVKKQAAQDYFQDPNQNKANGHAQITLIRLGEKAKKGKREKSISLPTLLL